MKNINFVSRPYMYFSEQGNVDDDATFITIFLVSFNLQSYCLMQSAVYSLRSAVCSLHSANVIHRGIVTTIAFHIRHFFAFITIYDICYHSECLQKVSEDYFSRGMLLVWTFAQKLRQQVNIYFTPYWNRCSHCKVYSNSTNIILSHVKTIQKLLRITCNLCSVTI